MSGVATWSGALDDFEAFLATASAALDAANEVDPVAPFSPPLLEDPFPVELTVRANELLARAAEMQVRIAAVQEGLRADLARLPRARREVVEAESRFEARA